MSGRCLQAAGDETGVSEQAVGNKCLGVGDQQHLSQVGQLQVSGGERRGENANF